MKRDQRSAWQALVEKWQPVKRAEGIYLAGFGWSRDHCNQLGKHLRATVATTAGEKNFEMLKNLGADILIDCKKDDFENILKIMIWY